MTFARRRKQTNVLQAFENEFAVETLKSERLRVTLLIGVVATTLLLQFSMSLVALDVFRRSFHGRFTSFLVSLMIMGGLVLTCLSIQRAVIAHHITIKGKPFPVMQYLSALIETSIPTAGMIIAAQFIGPIYTLFSPAPFVYGLFIVLSILRLDWRLCVFTGGVAALEYIGVASIYLYQTSPDGFEPLLVALPHHVLRGMILLVTGVAAGLVTMQIKKRTLKSLEMIDERNRISRTFGEYVSPVVMDKLLTLKPDLRSEKKEVCVMFLDIRDFTSFFRKTRAGRGVRLP